MNNFDRKIVVFYCNWCGYIGTGMPEAGLAVYQPTSAFTPQLGYRDPRYVLP